MAVTRKTGRDCHGLTRQSSKIIRYLGVSFFLFLLCSFGFFYVLCMSLLSPELHSVSTNVGSGSLRRVITKHQNPDDPPWLNGSALIKSRSQSVALQGCAGSECIAVEMKASSSRCV